MKTIASDHSFYQAAFHAAAAPVCITDGAGVIVDHNPAFAALAGKAATAVNGCDIASLFAPEVLQPWCERSAEPLQEMQFPWKTSPGGISGIDGICRITRFDARAEKPCLLWTIGFPPRDAEWRAFSKSLQTLTKGASMAMFMLDLQERIYFTNDACRENHMFRREPLPGEALYKSLRSAAYAHSHSGFQSALNGQHHRQRIKLRRVPDPCWFDLSFFPVYFAGQLRGVFVTCREITQQKKLENTLRLSSEINAAFTDQWPHAIVSFSRNGIQFANPAAERVFAEPLKKGQKGPSGALKENRPIAGLWRKLRGCLKSDYNTNHFEYCIEDASQGKRVIDVYCHRTMIEDEPVVVSSWMDITELRRVQDDLSRKAEELAILNQIAFQTSASLDLDIIFRSTLKYALKAVHANAGIVFMKNQSDPDVIQCVHSHGLSKADTDLLTPTRMQSSVSRQALKENRIIYVEDTAVADVPEPVRKAGITTFVIIPIFNKNKVLGTLNLGRRDSGKLRLLSEDAMRNIGYQVGVAVEKAELLRSRDQEIAERQKVESALQASEALYRQIIATSPEAVVLIDTKNKFLSVNDVFATIFGYQSAEEFMAAGIEARDFPTPSSSRTLASAVKLVRKQGRITHMQSRVRRRDGSYFTVEISASTIHDENHKPKAYLGILRDITDQENFAKTLRDSESRYRALAEAAHDMIYIIDRNDKVVYVNRFSALQFRMDPQEIIGKNRAQLFRGETSTHQEKNLNKVFKTGQPLYVEDVAHFPQQTLHLGTWLVPLRDQRGRVDQVLGLSRDITEFHENARKLEESEMRFRDIIERSLDGYYFIDREGVIRKVNRSFCEILRAEKEILIDRVVTEVAFPRHREVLKNIYNRVMSGKNIRYDELEIVPPNGKTIWISYNMRRVMDNGKVIGVEGFIRDITHLKQTQEALRVSEARYRSLFDSIQFEVYALDPDGRFRETTLAFQMVWGQTVGQKIEEAISSAAAESTIRDMLKRAKRQRSTVSSSFQLKNEEHTVSYSAILSPVMTDGKTVIGYVGINVDISEQVSTYDRLRTLSMRLVQVQEEERRRIAREIHDSLGQYLTALQLEVTAAIRALDGRQQIPKALSDAHKTIEESIAAASTLCYSLRPPLLDDFGLVAALQDYYMEFTQKWDIEISFQAAEIGTVLSKDGETTLFRISQEALTNVLKHAQATRVKVRLECTEDQVVLSIEDNGVGFDIDELQLHVSGTHFGLLTMKERVELLGGRLTVTSKKKNGTHITAWVPVITGGY